MGSHITDWHPGRVSREYRDNYDRIFENGPRKLTCGVQIDIMREIAEMEKEPCHECTCVGACEDCQCGHD